MAYQQTVGEMLANRLGAYQQAQQATVGQRMNAQRALGPIMAAPMATGPQYSIAQMLADSSNARPIATPGLNPAPEQAAPQVDPLAQVAQIAQALNPSAMPAAAGSAPATGDASAPSAEGFAPMIDAVKQFFTGNAPSMTGVPPQATSADAATAAAVLGNPAAAGATIGENLPQAPFAGVAEGPSPEAAQVAAAALGKPQDTMSSIGEWLTGLFSGRDTPAPATGTPTPAPNTPTPTGAAPAPATRGAAPTAGGLAELVTPSPREGIAPIATQAYAGIPFITDPATGRAIEPGQTAPAQQGALETAKAEQQAMRSQKATAAGEAVSTALQASNPDLPKAEASAVKSVFENEDLYKMMIATGAALDSGMSYGEAMLAGSQAFLGSQAARQKKAEQDAATAAAEAQQDFKNRLEVAKLDKGKLKEQAEIKLAEARTRAVEAGIPLNDERLKLIQAQTANAQAQAARANRDKSGGSSDGSGGGGKGISKKDYTKFVLDEKNRIEMNGEEVPEGLTGDQWARIRVNVAAGPDQAQYITPSTDVTKRVKELAGKETLTADEKKELGWYQNLYGDEY